MWKDNYETILQDGSALEQFKLWINSEPDQSNDAIDLYFAIKAFIDLIKSPRDIQPIELATRIHRRYTSMRTGSCDFLSNNVRRIISERMHSLLPSSTPAVHLFNPCIDEIFAHIYKQHAVWTASRKFREVCSWQGTDEWSLNYALSACDSSSATFSSDMENCLRMESGKKSYKLVKQHRSNQAINTMKHETVANTSSEEQCKRTCKKRRDRNAGDICLNSLNFDHDCDYQHQLHEGRERFVKLLNEKLQPLTLNTDHSLSTSHRSSSNVARSTVQPLKAQGEVQSTLSDDDSNDSIIKYEKRMNATDRILRDERWISRTASPSRGVHLRNIADPALYGQNKFAPPPGYTSFLCYGNSQCHNAFMVESAALPSAIEYAGHLTSDSSGFCSSESTNIIKRTALFQKARVMASHDNTDSTGFHQSSASSAEPYIPSTTSTSKEFNSNSELLKPLTVVYKDEDFEAPFVAKLNLSTVSYRDFRRCFGISSRTTKRCFFKNECEDGSAPFQWSIIMDDDSILPIFEGRITAECKSFFDFS